VAANVDYHESKFDCIAKSRNLRNCGRKMFIFTNVMETLAVERALVHLRTYFRSLRGSITGKCLGNSTYRYFSVTLVVTKNLSKSEAFYSISCHVTFKR